MASIWAEVSSVILAGCAIIVWPIVGCGGAAAPAADGAAGGGGTTATAGSGGSGFSLCRITALLGTSAAGKACRSSCASKLQACEEIPSCVDLDCCLADCNPTDTVCNTACSQSHLSGVVEFAYANQCVSNCAGLASEIPTSSADAGAKVDAGCSGRFEIIDAGNVRTSPLKPCPQAHSGCDGSGLVKDTETGLQWQRYRYITGDNDPWLTQPRAADYCSAKGMRLPTQDEAMGIMKTSNSACAWPDDWYTWTSTESQPGEHWYVMYNSTMVSLGEADGGALCLK